MENQKINFDEDPRSAITVRESQIVVEKLIPHLSSNKKMQAQLRSVVETTYPEARAGNSLNPSIFGNEEFKFDEGQTYEEKRVAWMDVPAGLTVQQVQERLNGYPDARLMRTLSLNPILTTEQVRAMETGLSTDSDGNPITIEHYEKTQGVVDPEGNAVPYKDVPQYRLISFSPVGKPDVDTRASDYNQIMNVQNETQEEPFTLNKPVFRDAPVRKESEF